MAGVNAEGDAATALAVATATVTADDSHGYFASYTDLKVHEVMLQDWPRNSAYRRFFEESSDLVRDKVVMDVGAGTGILSLFAASVGARKVYAVEASDTAHLCKEIVRQNGFADTIEVIHSAVEDVELGEGVKVDVIVSEWMGFYLLHESMLDSVIVARDRFLADDGIIVPSVARIYLAPVNMEKFLEEKFEFWTNVCGFDFSAAIPHVNRKLLQEPLTTELDERQVVAPPQLLREFDLRTVSVAQVQALSDSLAFCVDKFSTVHGFAIWFDVDFRQGAQLKHVRGQTDSSTNSAVVSTSANSEAPTLTSSQSSGADNWRVVPQSVLSTSPSSPVTHWKQTVVLLPRSLAVDPSDHLGCKVTLTQSGDNRRHYDIELELLDEEESEEEEDDHPVTCDCGQMKCRLIKALMERYGEEHEALEAEAEVVDLTAEVEAAEAISAEMGEDDDQLNVGEGS